MIFIKKRTMERNVLYFMLQFYNKRSNPGDKRSTTGEARRRAAVWIVLRVFMGAPRIKNGRPWPPVIGFVEIYFHK
jgi:hypothetical protein